jgi:hypothetical protein
MADTHAIKFYCRGRFEPISVDGSLLRPILGCPAPGPALPTGIYLVRMEAEGRTLTRSVIQSR